MRCALRHILCVCVCVCVSTFTVPFSTWMRGRPDLMSALAAVHANPGAALAPLPIPKHPMLLDVSGAFTHTHTHTQA